MFANWSICLGGPDTVVRKVKRKEKEEIAKIDAPLERQYLLYICWCDRFCMKLFGQGCTRGREFSCFSTTPLVATMARCRPSATAPLMRDWTPTPISPTPRFVFCSPHAISCSDVLIRFCRSTSTTGKCAKWCPKRTSKSSWTQFLCTRGRRYRLTNYEKNFGSGYCSYYLQNWEWVFLCDVFRTNRPRGPLQLSAREYDESLAAEFPPSQLEERYTCQFCGSLIKTRIMNVDDVVWERLEQAHGATNNPIFVCHEKVYVTQTCFNYL